MTTTKNYSAIIFDCDGVLVNREASEQLLTQDAKKLGIAPPDASFYTQVRTAMLQAFEHELIAVAGAHRLISRWPGQQAVASSSVAATLALKLSMTGLAPLFGRHVYSADVVAQGKPDPAIFLHAAEQLQVQPSQCLAIEDSINGVISAASAGMTVLGFTGGGHCLVGHDQVLLDAGAAQVFASHASIGEYLTLNE